MKITEALRAEHVVFHNLFDHLERALPKMAAREEVLALRDLLASMLKSHTDVEQALLLDPLEHCIDQLGHSENLHEEHDDIERHLESVTGAADLDAARRAMLTGVLLSREHFDKEERLVFALAEKHLSEKTLLELGRRWQEEHHADAPVKQV